MVYYGIIGHAHEYETQTVTQIFCPNEKYSRTETAKDGLYVLSIFDGNKEFKAQIFKDGALIAETCEDMDGFGEKEEQRLVKLTIYNAFLKLGFRAQPWGILTGIRPAKTAVKMLEDGASAEEIVKTLAETFVMSREKAVLSLEVAENERKILDSIDFEDLSVYIGVPFCPSRCLYCSFTSFPVERYTKMLPDYFAAFKKEMNFYRDFMTKCGKKIHSVYVGGGTPTALPPNYLARLLSDIVETFPTPFAEFTVEAGRPDTITAEKLEILKQFGVTRISINPQTLNDKTLAIIGRKHSAEDFSRAFYAARTAGFRHINTDIILGLPQESLADMEYTLGKILDLEPDSLTAHTLCVKRASSLAKTLGDYGLSNAEIVEKAIKIAYDRCKDMGLFPYYMYRQKNMLGNLENVGYCKKGYECAYNVVMMEETQSVLAAGAGAATKLLREHGRILRLFNVKGVEEYIARIDEMIDRKRKGLLE